jgi:hypothetical protein
MLNSTDPKDRIGTRHSTGQRGTFGTGLPLEMGYLSIAAEKQTAELLPCFRPAKPLIYGIL